MSNDIDIIGPNDQPALLGLSRPDWLARTRACLTEIGYKVHPAINQQDFLARYNRLRYNIAVIEPCFAVGTVEENFALRFLQKMSMLQRRHTTFFLIGEKFKTLDPMQAFVWSVNAVINPSNMDSLAPIIQQVVVETNVFLQPFREAMSQIAGWGR